MINIEQLRRYVRGFSGRFEFQPQETLDDEPFDDRLVFIDCDYETHILAEPMEKHIAEPIAEMLNATSELLAVYEEACAMRDARLTDPDEPPSVEGLCATVDASRRIS